MLKISVMDSRTERRLVLEGKLIAPWVGELRTGCKAADGELEGRASVVDLRNVTIISQEGQIALMSAGAKFRCSGVLTKHVLTTCTEETAGITTEDNMLEAKHITGSSQYARSGDLCRIFYEEIDSLYLLSLLLTADREKAEQCFVSRLEDSVNGNPVFKEWARSWARRTIIQNAVRVINPRPMEEDAPSNFKSNNKTLAVERAEVATVLELGSFERFVYVMSVLEHYSDQDCSVLLGCTLWDVIAARIRTLQQMSAQRRQDCMTTTVLSSNCNLLHV